MGWGDDRKTEPGRAKYRSKLVAAPREFGVRHRVGTRTLTPGPDPGI